MRKLYIARGYNSWTHKDMIRAFQTEQDADDFMSGLTDPHLQILAYKSTTELVNILLGNKEQRA